MSRQQREIRIGAYIYNGAYRLIPGSSRLYPVWNHDFNANLEFRSSAVNKAISGFERGNVSGYRVTFTTDLRNMYREDATELRTLFNLCASESVRTFDTTTTSALDNVAKTVVLDGKETIDDFYNGLYLVQGSNVARIVDYVGATRTATYVGDDIANGTGRTIAVYPDKPTILGISVDENVANTIYCNMVGSSIGLTRELTIGTQFITLQAQSVERFAQIPDTLAV